MSKEKDTQALANALLQRAKRLADEEKKLAEHERERILRAARERLAQRREQAERQASQAADQHYRRLVQRAEQDIRGKLEKLRWTLIEAVLIDLRNHLQKLHKDPDRYRGLLQGLLAEACSTLRRDDLVAQLNNRDHSSFSEGWQQLLQAAGCDRGIELSERRCDCVGGVLLENVDADLRLDNTFEARLERLAPVLARSIDAVLFSNAETSGDNIHAG